MRADDQSGDEEFAAQLAYVTGYCLRRLSHPSFESTIASDPSRPTTRTLVSPSMLRSFSAGTSFIGPGPTALPGCGCGKAVEHAV